MVYGTQLVLKSKKKIDTGVSRCEVPKLVYKDGANISVKGYVVSGSARYRYNVPFFGLLLERQHNNYRKPLDKEYVLGNMEIDKKSNVANPNDVRFGRFMTKKELVSFANQILMSIKDL